MYQLKYTAQARRDYKKIKESHLHKPLMELLDILRAAPYQNPPPYEMLRGDMAGSLSRRINRQHRLVYDVHEEEKMVKVLRVWTHYE